MTDSNLQPASKLEELAELQPLPELPAAAPAAAAALPRKLDQAPLLLRKAALVLVCASLLPWLGAPFSVLGGLLAKLVVLASAACFYYCMQARTGGRLPSPLASLGALRFVKTPVARPKSVPEQLRALLDQQLPTALHLAGLVLLIGGLLLPFFDANYASGVALMKAIAELGLLALGAFTFVQICGYERGGKFNPLFPMMFLAPAAAGLLRIWGNILESHWVGLLASIAVALAGCLAVYTMVVAMKQAKIEGDLKKRAASEARKALRSNKAKG